MRTRIRVLRRWALAASLLVGFAAASAPASAQGTPEQRQACAPDAIRLCRDFLPDVAKVTACMTAKKAELSGTCRDVMFAKKAAPRVASSHRKSKAAAHAARGAAAKTATTKTATTKTATTKAAKRAKGVQGVKGAKVSCEAAKGHKKHKTCKVVHSRG